MHREIRTNDPEETESYAEKIGSRLRGGEVIELVSDVGGGKTTFVRGLAKGAGSTNHVASPTFTISKEYKTPDFNIMHFDLYRLSDAGLIEHEIHESIADDTCVVVVEWSDVVRHVLPESRLRIIMRSPELNERVIQFTYPKELAYLVPSKNE